MEESHVRGKGDRGWDISRFAQSSLLSSLTEAHGKFVLLRLAMQLESFRLEGSPAVTGSKGSSALHSEGALSPTSNLLNANTTLRDDLVLACLGPCILTHFPRFPRVPETQREVSSVDRYKLTPGPQRQPQPPKWKRYTKKGALDSQRQLESWMITQHTL